MSYFGVLQGWDFPRSTIPVQFLCMVYNGDMAVNTPLPVDASPRTKVLSNGAVYDLDKGRIVANPGGGKHAITSDNARDMVNIRMEQKRQRLMAGANAVVAREGTFDGVGLDFAEAIGEAVTLAALDPTSNQQVKAAEFLFREAGIGERQAAQDTAGGTIGALADVIGALSAFAGSIAAISGDITNIISNDDSAPGGVVDADVIDADSMAEHGDTVEGSDTNNWSE